MRDNPLQEKERLAQALRDGDTATFIAAIRRVNSGSPQETERMSRKTAVGAPAPKPTVKEMLDAIDKMSWYELDDFRQKLNKKMDKRRDKINEDRARNSDY